MSLHTLPRPVLDIAQDNNSDKICLQPIPYRFTGLPAVDSMNSPNSPHEIRYAPTLSRQRPIKLVELICSLFWIIISPSFSKDQVYMPPPTNDGETPNQVNRE